MPSRSPQITPNQEKALRQIGEEIRARRKKLGISSIATAESAGMSRVTLHRIERGEASVAMGAYLSAIHALGLKLKMIDPGQKKRERIALAQGLPQKICIADYKQLKKLAWQLKGTKELSPKDVLDLYERNWRHVESKSMDPKEQKLLENLLAAFGRERLLV